MTKRRFQAVFAAILAQACAPPSSPSKPVSPPAATSIVAPVPPPQSPILDAGRDDAATVDAGAPVAATVDPLQDRQPNREYLGQSETFEWHAKDWPKIRPDALPTNVTFVATVWNGQVSDVIGNGPPTAAIVQAQKDKLGDAGANAAYDKPIVWIMAGVLTFGDRHDLRRALTPIDSREKAAMLLRYGYGATLRDDAKQSGKPCALCDGPLVRARDGGFEALSLEGVEENLGPCPHSNPTTVFLLASFFVDVNGQVSIRGTARPFPPPHVPSAHCVGRDTHGSGRSFRAPGSTGDYFAQLAHDEAISVRSFERLARELENAGNRRFSARARVAARQERGHARRMGALRRKHGGAIRSLPRTGKLNSRSLGEWLTENVREGCVNETYAALVAAWQAEHAPDAAMRATFRVIADEEREHARLASDIHAWALRRFPELAPTLEAARADAIGRLRAGLSLGRADVGEPPPDVAERFVAGLDQLFAA